MARLVLGLLLVCSSSLALAFRPAMGHHEDCPMPLENRGAPCALNAPTTPPPAALPKREMGVVAVMRTHSQVLRPSLAPVERVRSRDPPKNLPS